MTILTPEQSQDYTFIRSLAEQATHLQINSIQLLRGQSSYNYLLNQHLIFKLPQRKENLPSYRTIAKNAPVIQKYLSVRIPQPQIHSLFINGEPCQALTYEQIPGHTVPILEFCRFPQRQREYYFDQLAHIIHDLHSVPASQLPAPPPVALQVGLQKLFKRHAYLSTALQTTLQHCMGSRGDALIHKDLHSDNVCIGKNNQIVGIIDLEGIVRGQPFLSFHPTLYAPKDLQYLTRRYMSNYPKELSRLRLSIFQRSYNTMFYLLYLAQLMRPSTRVASIGVQEHHALARAFKSYD